MGYDVTKFFELCFVCIWFKALYRGPAGVNPFSLPRPPNWPKQNKIELAAYWPGQVSDQIILRPSRHLNVQIETVCAK